MLIDPSSFKVAIWWSGLIISTPLGSSISAAVTVPLPDFERLNSASSTSVSLTERSLRFNKISITSSWTPSIVLYSCKTPSIFTSDTAVPGIEDRIILLNALPSV